MAQEFKAPSFLDGNDLDTIHARMLENLPEDIDKSEGGHTWNLTMPAAYEKAYMVEFLITEAIKTIFPMFCEDYAELMDYHAQTRGIIRKEAEYATGEVTVTGVNTTEIPEGTMFSTMEINNQPSIDFVTTQDAVIETAKTVKIPIIATEPGTTGNVPANTIVLNSSDIDTIEAVTNEKETTGGVEEESTESLQARIMEYDKLQETSYGGSEADYRRWALSVNGTGGASIIHPPDDTTPIKIVLTDSLGMPANEELCEAVYNYIMRPDSPAERLAPVNDRIEVIPPTTINVAVQATIELETSASIIQIKKTFTEELQKYMSEVIEVNEIRYTKVSGILAAIDGVGDHKDLTINGGTVNIAVDEGQIPLVDEDHITLTEGTV